MVQVKAIPELVQVLKTVEGRRNAALTLAWLADGGMRCYSY